MSPDRSKTRVNRQDADALIQELIKCAIACEKCAAACLREENVDMMARCIELDRDCADTCLHTAKLLIRDSEISDLALAACERICKMCGEECRKHQKDHCQECADACERCADACNEYHGKLELT